MSHREQAQSALQRTEEDEDAELGEEHQHQKRDEEGEHALLLCGVCMRGEGSPH